MSPLITFLGQPFVVGLLFGLIFVAITWYNVRRGKHDLQHANAQLRKTLNTFMSIKEEGDASLKKQLLDWAMKCRNLELTNHRLLENPMRAQRMQLETYQRALDVMHERAPGFSMAWRKALEDAEEEWRRIAEGESPWTKLTSWCSGITRQL